MTEGIENAESIFLRFKANINMFLIALDS